MKKRNFGCVFLVVFIAIILYVIYAYSSSFIGWYGYRKWRYRIATGNIIESKERGVFIKELNYKIVDSANLNLKGFYFKPFIERGFRYGYHSSEETRIDNYTKYPYNFIYERNMKDSLVLTILEEDRKKLDSSNIFRGYLKQPYLKDTIRFEIEGSTDKKGLIKVWQK